MSETISRVEYNRVLSTKQKDAIEAARREAKLREALAGLVEHMGTSPEASYAVSFAQSWSKKYPPISWPELLRLNGVM